MKRGVRGFTLLEVMVALMLLAVFSIVSYRALDSLLQAERAASAEMAQWRDMASLFARLEADLTNAAPVRAGTPGFRLGGLGAASAQADWLRLRPTDEAGGLSRVSYRIEAGRASRLVWREHAPPGEAPSEQVLATGFAHARLRGMDEAGRWHETWPGPDTNSENGLPRAVEIELTRASGETVRRVLLLQ